MRARRIYDLFSIVRMYELMFNVVKALAKSLEPIVVPFLNWRLRPKRPHVLKRGSTLQMVIRPDEKYYVGWPVIRYILGPFTRQASNRRVTKRSVESENGPVEETNGIDEEGKIHWGRLFVVIPVVFLMAIAMLMILSTASPSIRSLLPGWFPDISITNLKSISIGLIAVRVVLIGVLFTAIVFSIWLIGLIYTYWCYEWERRHWVWEIFLEGLLNLKAEFVFSAVTPFYTGDNKKIDSMTPPQEVVEIVMVTDVEDLPNGEITSELHDKWSRYLSKKYQIAAIRVASRFGSHDILVGVKDAPNTVACISDIIERGKLYWQTRETFLLREQDALADGAGSSRFDSGKNVTEAKRVWDDFDLLYPQPVKRYENSFALEDPGIWDREGGEEVKVRSQRMPVSQDDPFVNQVIDNSLVNPSISEVDEMQSGGVEKEDSDGDLFSFRIGTKENELKTDSYEHGESFEEEKPDRPSDFWEAFAAGSNGEEDS